MKGEDGAVTAEALGLLQVTGDQLATVPGLTETARTIGAVKGIDYLADPEVAAMLHRHRESLSRMNSRGAWGGLLLAPGAAAAWYLIDTAGRGNVDTAVGMVLFTPVALLLSLSVYLLAQAFRARHVWLRSGTRDQINGYLQVLAAAGFPPHSLPAWLKPVTGRRWR